MRLNSDLIRFFLCILLTIFLAGCSNSEKRGELENYVKRIKSREIKEIEPLPEIKPYQTFTYADTDMRSPFIPSAPEEVARKSIADNGIRPDTHRRKEPLESFSLDSLRMVGTIEKDGNRWALIIDPGGMVNRVTKGSYVGQNDGRVDGISEEKVSLTEIIPDPNGGWRERKAFMALIENEATHKGKERPKSK